MDIKASISDTRKGFEESLASGDFYNRQTQDAEHLDKILQFIKITGGMKILDLGCGSGYLSFPIAENNPDCEVIGLDIVSDALNVNRAKAEERRLNNLSFVSYDGIDFPFDEGYFEVFISVTLPMNDDTDENKGTQKFGQNVMVFETDRLILREYTPDDFDALYEIMSDPETMQHYPAPFDKDRTMGWITWNLENYEKYGFGLWAVVLKETGEFIGDCGITIQNIDGEMLPEIGYHIHKKYWRRGFAKEAAQATRDWVFQNTQYDTIYSYMKYTNIGSYSTAMANGMKKVKEYPDPKNTISYAYAITREEWKATKGV